MAGGRENTMHLLHVPNEAEIKANLSHCHVCTKKVKLTREHIPPESAFNNCNRLWDRLVLSDLDNPSRPIQIRGGLWVKTLCEPCNTKRCSPYANEYVKFVQQLVESPKLFDESGQARLVNIHHDTLMIAKEIATMILAVEELSFAQHHPQLREFVLDDRMAINPTFRIYGFLVPDNQKAGTVLRFHGRVDTFAPGYRFDGGEISWFPFGFVYASTVGAAYEPDRLTDITHWFQSQPNLNSSDEILKLFCRTTAVDSIQCTLGNKRHRPQIDRISERYV